MALSKMEESMGRYEDEQGNKFHKDGKPVKNLNEEQEPFETKGPLEAQGPEHDFTEDIQELRDKLTSLESENAHLSVTVNRYERDRAIKDWCLQNNIAVDQVEVAAALLKSEEALGFEISHYSDGLSYWDRSASDHVPKEVAEEKMLSLLRRHPDLFAKRGPSYDEILDKHRDAHGRLDRKRLMKAAQEFQANLKGRSPESEKSTGSVLVDKIDAAITDEEIQAEIRAMNRDRRGTHSGIPSQFTARQRIIMRKLKEQNGV